MQSECKIDSGSNKCKVLQNWHNKYTVRSHFGKFETSSSIDRYNRESLRQYWYLWVNGAQANWQSTSATLTTNQPFPVYKLLSKSRCRCDNTATSRGARRSPTVNTRTSASTTHTQTTSTTSRKKTTTKATRIESRHLKACRQRLGARVRRQWFDTIDKDERLWCVLWKLRELIQLLVQYWRSNQCPCADGWRTDEKKQSIDRQMKMTNHSAMMSSTRIIYNQVRSSCRRIISQFSVFEVRQKLQQGRWNSHVSLTDFSVWSE